MPDPTIAMYLLFLCVAIVVNLGREPIGERQRRQATSTATKRRGKKQAKTKTSKTSKTSKTPKKAKKTKRRKIPKYRLSPEQQRQYDKYRETDFRKVEASD